VKTNTYTNSVLNAITRQTRILLIEEDAAALDLIHKLLEEMGHSVISFFLEAPALEKYREAWQEIDIVAVGMRRADSDDQIGIALQNINPGARILFYRKDQIAAGLYIYQVEHEGFKNKINRLMGN